MAADHEGPDFDLGRLRLLVAMGLGSGALVAAPLNIISEARAGVLSDPSPNSSAVPPVAGLHLQFGADASSEITVSWHALQPVSNPRVVLGRRDGRFEQTAAATPTSYSDGKSSQAVYAYHAKLAGLQPELGLHVRRRPRRGGPGIRNIPNGAAPPGLPLPSRASATRARQL